MKSITGKGLIYKSRKIILFSVILLSIAFTGCKEKPYEEPPNYPAKVIVSQGNMNSKENSGTTVKLKAVDENPEDNPVSINKATSLDGKAWLTLNETPEGYDLKVETPYTLV